MNGDLDADERVLVEGDGEVDDRFGDCVGEAVGMPGEHLFCDVTGFHQVAFRLSNGGSTVIEFAMGSRSRAQALSCGRTAWMCRCRF